MTGAVLAATFEPPSTNDFVYGCWGSAFKIFGFTLCFNFIALLLVLTTLIVLALFFFAFRKPKVMPGKFQLLMELGVQFVRENIAEPMLGPDAPRFMPLLASFFFFILEVGLIATLQAFIFSTLTAIYLGGATSASH